MSHTSSPSRPRVASSSRCTGPSSPSEARSAAAIPPWQRRRIRAPLSARARSPPCTTHDSTGRPSVSVTSALPLLSLSSVTAPLSSQSASPPRNTAPPTGGLGSTRTHTGNSPSVRRATTARWLVT